MWDKELKPFSTYNKYAADDLENVRQQCGKHVLANANVLDKVETILAIAKKCALGVISPFASMLSKFVCCRCVVIKLHVGKAVI